jgi:hypothetical protein
MCTIRSTSIRGHLSFDKHADFAGGLGADQLGQLGLGQAAQDAQPGDLVARFQLQVGLEESGVFELVSQSVFMGLF